MPSKYEFEKKNYGDKTWWVSNVENIGEFLFSFDREKIYNLFRDYPDKMTQEEVRIFDRENPYWANFFKDRKK